MMADHISLKIGSYNCRGYNAIKREYINDLLSKVDVLCIQEHWLSDAQLNLIGTINDQFTSTGVSGFDNTEILRGRPYGGCAVMWRQNIGVRVEVITVDSKRVCAVRFITSQWKLMVVCAYMPYEDGEARTDDFVDQLRCIECLVNDNSDCHIVVCGDFNVDFARNWLHTVLLSSFCENLDIIPAHRHHRYNIDFTYSFDSVRNNTLDHFILSGMLYENCIRAVTVLHDVDNLSDHDPILLHLSLETEYISLSCEARTPRASWQKANDMQMSNYCSVLRENLASVNLPTDVLMCHDVNCCDGSHYATLGHYIADITCACSDACKKTIPTTACKQVNGRIAGWSEYVQPYKEKSVFWHTLWVNCGRPRSGAVADCMRRTRAAYHYAIRGIKKDGERVQRERMAHCMLNNDDRNFWAEVKKIRGNRRGRTRIVDGKSDSSSIAEVFVQSYKSLFTSVPYNKSDMQAIIQENRHLVGYNGYTNDCLITVDEVRNAVHKLKAYKRDGNFELSSDHFLNAGDDLFCHVALLLSAMVVHGHCPEQLNVSTLIPIPKGCNVNSADSNNYRGIALSPIFVKILDHVILMRYHSKLMSSDLQFGFKAKCSTNLCSVILKETMSYYVNNNSMVFCTFLDATKAFDRIRYCKLFRLLSDRGIPPCIIRILLGFYTHNLVRVVWNGILSDYFLAVNGVKQGGVLSPIVFSVYIDGLLVRLTNSNVGCYVGSFFVGALAYADDIVLLAPTPSAMRRMLQLCDDYANEHSIMFNAKKSKCLVASPRKRHSLLSREQIRSFSVGGNSIDFVESFVHLGHVISSKLNDCKDIENRRCNFIGQTNNVLCYFGKLDSVTKHKLFSTYCSSMYGCQLWSLDDSSVNDLCTAWRKGLRRIWSVPYNTHGNILYGLSGDLPIYDEICKRSLHFVATCLHHSCDLISFFARHGITCARGTSIFGRNITTCSARYNFTVSEFLAGIVDINAVVRQYCRNTETKDQARLYQFMRDLIACRDWYDRDSGCILSRDELCDIINFLAAN